MILVTGATGTIGSEVVAALQASHASRVRALTRNTAAVFPDGVEKVVADLGHGDLAPALHGADAVFLLTDGLHIAEHDRRVAAAAAKAGVRRIVKLSALSVGHGATDPITSWHRAGEQAIRDTGMSWTFLRPTAFMSNALNWAPAVATHGVVRAPFVACRTAVVNPADVAAVAASCLIEDGHDNTVYELTGPEPLSPPDQVAILSRVLGRRLGCLEVDPVDVVAQMTSYGMPVGRAGARRRRAAALRSGAVQLRGVRRHRRGDRPAGAHLRRMGGSTQDRLPADSDQLVKGTMILSRAPARRACSS